MRTPLAILTFVLLLSAPTFAPSAAGGGADYESHAFHASAFGSIPLPSDPIPAWLGALCTPTRGPVSEAFRMASELACPSAIPFSWKRDADRSGPGEVAATIEQQLFADALVLPQYAPSELPGEQLLARRILSDDTMRNLGMGIFFPVIIIGIVMLLELVTLSGAKLCRR
ncbi:MAG: hypothetical protein JSS51_09115 [Planctomycetes bacterium]|nr:hypothetical protein [Planctomycetota bacterium]